MRAAVAVCALLLAQGCSCEADDKRPAPERPPPAPSASSGPIIWRYPAVRRVVALGDVHGDLRATRAALLLGGLMDDNDRWVGADTVLVQTGDVLDRGSDEQAILDLLLSLQKQAAEAGGAVHLLNGNHELMNVAGDFRYVTPGGFTDFEDMGGFDRRDPRLAGFGEKERARAAAFLPGGFYARHLATHPVVVVVGETVFAHGGVLPKYTAEIDQMNNEVAEWLLGRSARGHRLIRLNDSPVWSRHYSDEPDEEDCKLLDKALGDLGVTRMVVGHTVQPTIRPACDDKVWRVDVGMSAAYGGKPEVLEIQDGAVKALR